MPWKVGFGGFGEWCVLAWGSGGEGEGLNCVCWVRGVLTGV